MKKFFLLALICGCGPVEDSGSDEESIQGGRADKQDHAVGMIWFEGGGFCSGTLIAPDVVLTAAHCVTSKIEGFYLGTSQGAPAVTAEPVKGFVRYDVSAQAAHPSYSMWGGCPNRTVDVGLVHLAKPIKDIEPVARAKSAPPFSSACRTVGYGVHNQDADTTTYEQKRTASVWVKEVGDSYVNVLWKSGISDKGDSGGPLLCDDQIAGVTSCKSDGDYPNHRSGSYGRIDNIGKWIDATIKGWKSAS